jgi:hypothetical protein
VPEVGEKQQRWSSLHRLQSLPQFSSVVATTHRPRQQASFRRSQDAPQAPQFRRSNCVSAQYLQPPAA